MDLEDFEPRKIKPKPKDLGTFSVDELKEYIANLQAEITRAEQTIAAKQDHKTAAAKFFKS